MTLTTTIFTKNRRLLSFGLAVILLCLTIISPGTFRSFVGNITAAVFLSPFSELKNYILELQHVAAENRRLSGLLTDASLQLAALAEAQRENERLRELLGFDPHENFRLVPVKIVSLVQNVYPLAAVINKGYQDSILVDYPVINRFGLVGKIKNVMSDYAVVALLTDPANPVSGRIADSRQIGIVRFSLKQGMYLDNLPADANIQTGDLIITSGLGGIYPSGLSVAVVDSASAKKGDIMKSVWLRPTVNFYEIDELYVLIGKHQ